MAIARSVIRMPTAPDSLVGRTGGSYVVPWKGCIVCRKTDDATTVFKSPREFCRHLRDYHCTKEGGSFVCHYGPNGVCPSLPVEGVSDQDYEDHVARDHVAADSMSPASTPASPGSVNVNSKISKALLKAKRRALVYSRTSAA